MSVSKVEEPPGFKEILSRIPPCIEEYIAAIFQDKSLKLSPKENYIILHILHTMVDLESSCAMYLEVRDRILESLVGKRLFTGRCDVEDTIVQLCKKNILRVRYGEYRSGHNHENMTGCKRRVLLINRSINDDEFRDILTSLLHRPEIAIPQV